MPSIIQIDTNGRILTADASFDRDTDQFTELFTYTEAYCHRDSIDMEHVNALNEIISRPDMAVRISFSAEQSNVPDRGDEDQLASFTLFINDDE